MTQPELAGFGSIDASCVDGRETRAIVDVGDLLVTGGSIEATSSAGAICDLPSGHGSKFSVECESESDDPAALEPKAEVEVEVELEEHEEEEEEVEVD